jgi:hypothetical protein
MVEAWAFTSDNQALFSSTDEAAINDAPEDCCCLECCTDQEEIRVYIPDPAAGDNCATATGDSIVLAADGNCKWSGSTTNDPYDCSIVDGDAPYAELQILSSATPGKVIVRVTYYIYGHKAGSAPQPEATQTVVFEAEIDEIDNCCYDLWGLVLPFSEQSSEDQDGNALADDYFYDFAGLTVGVEPVDCCPCADFADQMEVIIDDMADGAKCTYCENANDTFYLDKRYLYPTMQCAWGGDGYICGPTWGYPNGNVYAYFNVRADGVYLIVVIDIQGNFGFYSGRQIISFEALVGDRYGAGEDCCDGISSLDLTLYYNQSASNAPGNPQNLFCDPTYATVTVSTICT